MISDFPSLKIEAENRSLHKKMKQVEGTNAKLVAFLSQVYTGLELEEAEISHTNFKLGIETRSAMDTTL